LQVSYNRNLSKGLQVLANYTYAREMTYNGSWTYGMSYGYGPGSYDVRHTLNFSHIYELPFGNGRAFLNNLSGPANTVLGGWALNGQWQIHSGMPTTPSYNNAGCPNCPFQAWPDLVGDPYSGNGAGSELTFWNKAAFQDVPAGVQRQGTASWNDLRGPGFWTSNMSLYKKFQVTERVGAQLRFDVFNVFNHVNWATPNSNIDSSDFGKVTSTAIFAGDLPAQRSGQVGLKLTF
jgi:hypothetical protein